MAKPKNDYTKFTKVGAWAWRSDLLWKKIRKGENADDCWTWIGSRSEHANLFGAYKNQRQQMTQAIRIIFRELTNKDCDDLSFRHTCGDKYCCNLAHIQYYPNNRKFNSDGTPINIEKFYELPGTQPIRQVKARPVKPKVKKEKPAKIVESKQPKQWCTL